MADRPTPLTDAEVIVIGYGNGRDAELVGAYFARQLERSNAELAASLKEMRALFSEDEIADDPLLRRATIALRNAGVSHE